ncbi:MAG: anti-sigma factor family protein [Isosphaeraceae bacterium]
MSLGPEQRLTPEERANLVAYLDGELTENEERRIATKLSQSRTARLEVESLKQTWELLEHLPRPQASADFPERMMTSIRTMESKAHSWETAAQLWGTQIAKMAVCLLVAAASLATGFALCRWAWPDPAIRIAQNLSLAEHLDEYQEVGSFQLLEELANSREFEGPSY